MANVKVYNMSGAEVGTIELSDAVFGVEINEHVMHLAVKQYLANQRQGTQSAKTRSEVSGGGKKPFRQKGTGRARQGSIRAPQWTGGGVVFAPKPRDYSFKLNKKVKRLALKSISQRLRQRKWQRFLRTSMPARLSSLWRAATKTPSFQQEISPRLKRLRLIRSTHTTFSSTTLLL